jgi:aspartate racemase
MIQNTTPDAPKYPRTIGILGGMGPHATARLFDRIIALTPATTDQEHLPVLICNWPQVPDRTAAIKGHGESPVPVAGRGLKILTQAGADFIAIPCNTIHAFLPQLQAETTITLLDLIAEVRDAATERWPGGLERLGLLATDGTLASAIYQKSLAAAGCYIVLPDAARQREVMACIDALKSGERRFREALAAGRDLLARGVQGIILGCTELSLVRDLLASELPIIDSTEVLAKACVDIAVGTRDVPRREDLRFPQSK